jgi:superoxide dismutase, Cu-Zn family
VPERQTLERARRDAREGKAPSIDCARSQEAAPGRACLHVHQMAKCDVPTFESAGPHFNPDGKQHGLQNPQGPHAGDMNNLTVAANGVAKTTVVNPRVTLMTGGNSVFAGDGTALVIHAQADDMKSDPAGNAGIASPAD